MEINFINKKWTAADIPQFQEYIKQFSNAERIDWTRKIINTALPLLAIPSPKIKAIAKEIGKGDYISFLDVHITEFYDNIVINACLIMNIKDFDLMLKYLIPYSESAENWAVCDMLNIKVNSKDKAQWFALSKEFIASPKPFVRRIGMIILFQFVSDSEYIHKIYDILNGFKEESAYYVNMVNAWLIAECFTKQRDTTIGFLDTHNLNKFTINKAISKCRDSFRVSPEDKQMLLKYKQ